MKQPKNTDQYCDCEYILRKLIYLNKDEMYRILYIDWRRSLPSSILEGAMSLFTRDGRRLLRGDFKAYKKAYIYFSLT